MTFNTIPTERISRKRKASSENNSNSKRLAFDDVTNKVTSSKQLNFVDIDAVNKDNINEAPEYAFDIFEYMRAREHCYVIKENFLSDHDVTPKMRTVLVDWMVEIQEKFQLHHETLYLAVKLVDHYLQQVDLSREKLQLLGATSLLIAAKFDESILPFVDDYLFICDDAYQRSEMLAMERSILTQVGFDINIPISYRFLRRFAKCTNCGMKTLTLARYILESSLQTYSFVDRSASKMAAAALWLALKMASNHKWDDALVYYTSYTEQDIVDLAFELNSMANNVDQTNFNTVFSKYSHPVFHKVASIPALSKELFRMEHFYFEM